MRILPWLLPLLGLLCLSCGGDSAAGGSVPPPTFAFSTTGHTRFGDFSTQLTLDGTAWKPGQKVAVKAELSLSSGYLAALATGGLNPDRILLLLTAERTFDADGWMRLPSDEKMSTLVTPTGLAIEGGIQGAVTGRFGYPFKSPFDLLLEQPPSAFTAEGTAQKATFTGEATLPDDLPPGLYRIRVDGGLRMGTKVLNLNGYTFASRPFSSEAGTWTYGYSPLLPASGTHASGRAVDAAAIPARVPWVLLGSYNSNGYQGVVAEEDAGRFALSPRTIMPDEVVLPRYDTAGKALTYSLEPSFPCDTIDALTNLAWDFTKGELSGEVVAPDGTRTVLPATPVVAKSGSGPTTKNAAFTAWKPGSYGLHTVKLSGWVADAQGRRIEGGGTYRFWIAKRMTLATATFQGQPYAVGGKYGRDIAFNPPVPADVTMTATLYPNSDPAQARSLTCSGKATAGGLFGAAQGLKQLTLDAPGEYHGKVLATYTDAEGHLWVCPMRHAGVVYPLDSPIAARGKKLNVKNQFVERGETQREGWVDPDGTLHLEHLTFPYNPGDVLLIASEGQGANKIEPVLIRENVGETKPWDTKLTGVGTTNLYLRTSNGYSPHLYPEYITDRQYYYGAGPRPGFMSRFLVGESTVRAPYWPVSPNSFGGQIGASPNGDLPGDIYRLLGGVVVRDAGKTPLYAGYMASAFLLPRGTKNNRVVAPGAEELIGPTGEKAKFFLVGFRPGMALELGGTWRPAAQIDPMVPATLKVTLTYPDGRVKTAESAGDTSGSWAGPEAYPLDVPGVYRYQLTGSYLGATGKVPGLPPEGGAFFVFPKDRPAGFTGMSLDLPALSTFPVNGKLTVTGRSSAPKVTYALIMPGCVLAQGELPVVGSKFSLLVDPVALHAKAPIYDIASVVTGAPQIGRVLHLTFAAPEKAADGSTVWDFKRVVIRGNQVHVAR